MKLLKLLSEDWKGEINYSKADVLIDGPPRLTKPKSRYVWALRLTNSKNAYRGTL